MSHEGASTETDLLAPFRLKKCVACGYDLRGRGDAANCPECGVDISDALVVPAIKRDASNAWIAITVFCVLAAWMVFGRGNPAGPLGYGVLAAIVVLWAWRHRPRHKLGEGSLLITSTCVGADDAGKLRTTALGDLLPFAVHREAPLPKTSHGQPLFRWKLEFCDIERSLSTHFRATEEQANALREEVVRRMEAVRGDAPVE